MATEAEIKARYKEIHDNLSEDYYKNHLMSKEDFDFYHGQNWNDMEAELIAEGYLKPPEPVRDALAEIDELKAEQDEINEKLNLLLEKE